MIELLDRLMTDEKPKTLSVKLQIDVIEAARIVAAYRNESMTDMLSDILRPVLARMEQDEVAKRTGHRPGHEPPPVSDLLKGPVAPRTGTPRAGEPGGPKPKRGR